MKDSKIPSKENEIGDGNTLSSEENISTAPIDEFVDKEIIDQPAVELTKKELEDEMKKDKRLEEENLKKMKEEKKLKDKEEKKKMEKEQETEKKIQEEQKKQDEKATELEKQKKEKSGKERENDNKERVHKMEDDLRTKSKRKPFKLPLWLRGFNLILGAILIGITSYVIIDHEITLDNMIDIFIGLLVLLGAVRVVNAFYDKDLSGTKRVLTFAVGTGLIVLGFASYVTPDLGQDVVIILLSIGLMAQGFARVFLGLFNNVFPTWYRSMIFTAGILSIIIPGYILYQGWDDKANFEDKDAIRLLAYTFFFYGISRVGRALTGIGSKKR